MPALLLLVVCSSLTLSARAQSLTPSSATLEAPRIGDSASSTFTLDAGGTVSGVELCIPDCDSFSDEDFDYVDGSGSLSSGASTWTLDGSGCPLAGEACKILVTYKAGDELQRKAELRVITGFPDGDPYDETDTSTYAVHSAFLSGTVRESKPGTLEFGQSDYRVQEGGTVDVLVERVGGADGRLEANWSVFDPSGSETADGEPASTDDYEVIAPASDTFVWEDGDASPRTITLAANRDLLAEPTETVTLVIETADGCCEESSGFSADSTDVFIIDLPPQPGTARFEPTAYRVTEGESVDVMVERVDGADGELSVSWLIVEGGTAGAGDYRLASSERTLRWADGETAPLPITVLATLDEVANELPESFSISLYTGSESCCEELSEIAEITIIDATIPPSAGTLAFAQAALSVAEDAGPATLTLTRTGGSDGIVSVDYRLLDGTATFGEDYGDAGSGTTGRVTWLDDDAAPKRIDVPIAEDLVREPTDETFSVALSLPARDPDDTGPGATLGAPATATVSIVDTTPPPDTLALARASHAVGEADGTLDIVVRRLGGGTGAASVGYRLVAGSATATLDFAPADGRVSWAAGETADKSIPVRIVDDDLPEPDETFTLVLEGPLNALVGEPGSGEITISDDDPPGSLAFDPARVAVAEDAGSVTLTVTRTGGDAGAATVSWTASDRTARAGADYAVAAGAARSGTLDWAAGDDGPRTITLDIAEDELLESEENFVVTLSNASGAALGEENVANVLIGDTTVTPLDRVRFAAAETRVGENAGTLQLLVQRVGNGEGRVSVGYTIDAGTTTLGVDTAPGTPSEGVLAWGAGDTEDRLIGIAIVDDTSVEEDERFTVTLSGPDNAAIGSPGSNEVTIVDDDVPPVTEAGTLRFAAGETNVVEGAGRITIGVERIDGSDGELSVRYATVDAGATAGSDYTSASGTLVWADGESDTRFIGIDIATDALVEDEERFLVQLREATALGEPLPLEASEITVTIADATRIGTLVVLDPEANLLESDGQTRIRVSRTGGSDGVLQARYESVAETATAGEDFTPLAGVLEWADGESGVRELAVQVADDTANEANETFRVRFFETPPQGSALLANGDVQVTIIDDDEDAGRDPTGPIASLGSLRLVVVSGDGQSGLPGNVLEPMLAEVVDSAANETPRADVPVRWRVNPAGSAELLDGERTASDENGRVRNRVRVLSRGFLNVVATIDAADAEDGPDTPPGPTVSAAAPGQAVFLVRAGLAANGANGNQIEVGRALDTACDALEARLGDGEELGDEQLDLFATCGELEARLGDGRLPTALDRLAPEELFAIADSVIDTTDIQVTNVYARINAIRGERRRGSGGAAGDTLDLAGLGFELYGERVPGIVVDAAKNAWTGGGAAADGDLFGTRLGFFVNGTVSYGTVDSDGNQADADVSTRGLTVGADYRLSAETVVGVGLGIVANETEFVPDDGSVDANGVNLTLFGTWYDEESGYLDAVLDIGRNTYDVRRRINLPGLADQFGVGDTDADVLSLTLGAGKDTAFGAYELGPYVRATHTRAEVGGYSERASGSEAGAGSVLDIRGHDIRSNRLAVGGQLSRSISTRRGVVVPQLRIETQFEFDERKKGIEASFQHDPSGTPFTVNGDERDNGYLNIGLGASAVFANGRSGFIFYETRAAHEYITQHWLKAGVRLEF